ncbi:hypothetical protein [Zavarzinella formosa]|uniref:hypothetical protein n=1 Tax=Zavarzinella formosa TaxID=360055 RepID=UPI0002E1CB5C|nr:hypothetical protein [Zavarzinella formosa]
MAGKLMRTLKWIGAELTATDVRGWVNNGLQELQSVFYPGTQGVQPGTNATLGTVTPGEVTTERLKESQQPEMDME